MYSYDKNDRRLATCNSARILVRCILYVLFTALIQLGTGEKAYQNEILQGRHEDGRPIAYVGFSTGWDSDGLWEVEDIAG